MWGVPFDELERRRQARAEAAQAAEAAGAAERQVPDRAPLTSEEDAESPKAD